MVAIAGIAATAGIAVSAAAAEIAVVIVAVAVAAEIAAVAAVAEIAAVVAAVQVAAVDAGANPEPNIYRRQWRLGFENPAARRNFAAVLAKSTGFVL